MKTIAFYSYKGGVGRSLSLVNIANRLAEFGKKVCVIDFDLEAPGLDCKFHVKNNIEKGLVDYIYDFAFNDKVNPIKDYSIEIPLGQSRITFIPAGNTQSNEYWRKLSRINWWNLFYDEDSQGMEFFLNMKQQIKDTINPDYILIDNRTGITETSSLTLSLLADRVVILAANNKENLEGSKRIINSLTNSQNKNIGSNIHFVLTRMPYPETNDFSKDQVIIKQKFDEVKIIAFNNNSTLKSTNVIHSYRELEEDESKAFYKGFRYSKSELDNEYLKLYDALTKDDFTDEEKANFDKELEYQDNYNSLIIMYMKQNKSAEFWSLSEKLLETTKNDHPKLAKIKFIRIAYALKQEEFEKAVEEGEGALQLGLQNEDIIFSTYLAYIGLKEQKKAFKLLLKVEYNKILNWRYKILYIQAQWYQSPTSPSNEEIKEWLKMYDSLLEQYPHEEEIYNSKACLFRKLGEFDNALKEVYKALELNNEFNLGYSTLAEIKYSQKDKDGFYQNLELAFKYGFKLDSLIYDDDINVYREVMHEERFINLLKKYNQILVTD